MKTRFFRVVSLFICLILIFYLSGPSLLRFSGYSLHKTVSLENPDLIIVLAGDSDGSRLDHAVDLYKRYPKAFLLFTGGKYYNMSVPQLMKKKALLLGIPSSKIILEENATSSYENALFTKKIIQNRKFKSVLLVTSLYHTKRSFLVFLSMFEESSIELGVSGAEDGIDYSSWWRDKARSEIVFIELAKLFWYRVTIL